MATLVTRTVGTSGRNYSTLAAVLAATPSNLTTVDEQHDWELANDTEFTSAFNLTGITPDATRYIHIKTMSGHSWKDHPSVDTNPGFYNQTYGVGIKTTASYTTTLTIGVAYTRVTGLQMQAADNVGCTALSMAADNVEVRDCICHGRAPIHCPPSTGLKFVNNLGISRNGNLFGGTVYANSSRFEFNQFARVSSGGGNLGTISYAAVTCENCTFLGFSAGFTIGVAGSLTADYCATTLASLSGGGTHNQLSLTFSAQVESTTTDFRAKAGGSLQNGTPATTYATTDARGVTRDATTPTMGYWELAGGGGANPFLGQSTTLVRWPATRLPTLAAGTPQTLQGELPLPSPVAATMVRRPWHIPPDQLSGPALAALDPHMEDFPVAPWVVSQTRPLPGAWRPVGVAEGQTPPVTPQELPPGQRADGRGARISSTASASWDLFWTPPDVLVALPPGAAEGGVPGRATPADRTGLYLAMSALLAVEYPPGQVLGADARALPRGPAGAASASLALLSVVLPPPPAGPAAGGAPPSAVKRGRTVVWSWTGYIPPPATPLPPGASRGPFAARGHGHAPVAPYLSAYVISIPPALYGPAEQWQFPGGLTLYTFGGDWAAAWEFQADCTIWEW